MRRILWVMLLCCEAASVLLFLTGWSYLGALLCHLLASLFALLLWRREFKASPLVAARAALLVVFFPVAGVLGAWLSLVATRKAQRGLIEAYRSYIAFDPLQAHRATLFRRAEDAVRRELSVRPLSDELRQGSFASKQAASMALAAMGDASGVKILRDSVQDEDLDTRLFASLGLLRMDERFVQRIRQAQEQLELDGSDPVAWIDLAEANRAYATSGLPSGEAAIALWQHTLRAAEKGRDLARLPEHALQAWLQLATARLALGDTMGSLDAAHAAHSVDPGNAEALYAVCEALYGLRDFARLRGMARDLLELASPESKAYDVASFWCRHAS